MPVRHVRKEKLKVKQETTETTKQVKAHDDDVIVICDDPEVVVIDADNGGSDLPAVADDNPAFAYCGGCETYPESGTCDVCGTVYNCFDPFADEFLNTVTADDLVIVQRLLPLDPFIKARMM